MSSGVGAVGVLLAAGAGRRAGGPKALRHDPDGSAWLSRTVEVLRDGGCDEVVVVLGAGADAAEAVLGRGGQTPPGVRAVRAEGWSAGMGASLRHGLAEVGEDADVACVHLVDLPDVGSDVVTRVLAHATATTLVRAVYGGRPGHPVAVGRDHRAALAATLTGDEGGRRYLRTHAVQEVECGDLAGGTDRDDPPGA